MKLRISVLAFLVVALALPGAVIGQANSIAGKWDVVVTTDQGDIPALLTITQTGDKLAATISGPQGELPADASYKDSVLTLAFTMQTQNGPLDISMSGKVDGKTIQGSVDIAGAGAASWTARQVSGQDPKPGQGQEKPAATMTGTWAIEANHSAGTSTPTVTITQTGEKLSGKYVGSYGEAPLTGSIKGSEFTFRVEIGTEQKVEVVYTGPLTATRSKGRSRWARWAKGPSRGRGNSPNSQLQLPTPNSQGRGPRTAACALRPAAQR